MYLDQKITVWQRVHFETKEEMEETIAKFKNNEYQDINDVCKALGKSAETLEETEEIMTIDENDGQETIEIHEGEEIIFRNTEL